MKRMRWNGGAVPLLLAAALTSSLTAGAAVRPKPRITAAQARQIALKKYPLARVEPNTPLEKEDGRWQYAVSLTDRTVRGGRMHEVMVGAISGKIEADELTTPREEAREKAAETRAPHSGSRASKARHARG